MEKSGAVAPSRITTPMPTRPRSTRLPGVSFPVFSISVINGPEVIRRSAGLPEAMMSRRTPVGPTVNSKVSPLCFLYSSIMPAITDAHRAGGDHLDLGGGGGGGKQNATMTKIAVTKRLHRGILPKFIVAESVARRGQVRPSHLAKGY